MNRERPTTMSDVTLQGVEMTVAAAENVAEGGMDVAADVAALRAGTATRETLLAECLDGADDDRIQGWHDYVSSVTAAVDDVAPRYREGWNDRVAKRTEEYGKTYRTGDGRYLANYREADTWPQADREAYVRGWEAASVKIASLAIP